MKIQIPPVFQGIVKYELLDKIPGVAFGSVEVFELRADGYLGLAGAPQSGIEQQVKVAIELRTVGFDAAYA